MEQFNQLRENKTTQFVLNDIQSFEELKAANLLESEGKFTEALQKSLEKGDAEEEVVGQGSQSLVQKLKNAEGIVIKRLMFGKELKGQNGLTPDKYFAKKRREHELVKSYFGLEFVPHTEFVEVNTNFNSPRPDTIPGHEYILVQEELAGEDVSFQGGAEPFIEKEQISPELKKELLNFIDKYKKMADESHTVIEDQIRVDFSLGKVFIQDTDYLFSYQELTTDNMFLKYIGRSEAEVGDVRSLIKLLSDEVPAWANLHNSSGEELANSIPLLEKKQTKEAFSWLTDRLFKEKKPPNEIQAILKGLSKLIYAVDYFPPAGDNVFIKQLKKSFYLDTVDDQPLGNNEKEPLTLEALDEVVNSSYEQVAKDKDDEPENVHSSRWCGFVTEEVKKKLSETGVKVESLLYLGLDITFHESMLVEIEGELWIIDPTWQQFLQTPDPTKPKVLKAKIHEINDVLVGLGIPEDKWHMWKDPLPLSKIEPIEQGGIAVDDREDLKYFVEIPLLEACQKLFDKGIYTVFSSANKKDIEVGHAYITLDFDALSPANRKTALSLGKEGIIHGSVQKKGVYLEIPVNRDSTLGQIRRTALDIVGKFESQNSK